MDAENQQLIRSEVKSYDKSMRMRQLCKTRSQHEQGARVWATRTLNAPNLYLPGIKPWGYTRPLHLKTKQNSARYV
jgi:hypothetical protein